MKKQRLLLALTRIGAWSLYFAIMQMASFDSYVYAAAWQIETVDDYHVGKFNSIAVDAGGQPHISYYDEAKGDVKYATKLAESWLVEVVANAGAVNAGSIAVYTAISVDSRGSPHIIYYDDNQHQLRYAFKSSGSWSTEVVDSGSALNGFHPSLVLDSSDSPHISYYGSPGGINNGYLKYAYKSGGSWTIEIADTDGDTGSETSIALDTFGRPHIAYLRYPGLLSHAANTLKYAVKTARNWATEVVDASVVMSHFCSIALDSAGTPQISYQDYEHGYLMHAARTGGVWNATIVDKPADSSDVGRYSSITIDTSDITHISYMDLTNRDLKHAIQRKGLWTIEVIASKGDAGRFSDIASDSSGGIHISYYDAGVNQYSLKYVQQLPGVKRPVGKEILAISPIEFPYKVTFETRCAESLEGVCLHREIVRVCVGGNCFEVPKPITGPGCVLCDLEVTPETGRPKADHSPGGKDIK